MGSPPLFDLKALIAPIPGDDPAGGPVPVDVRENMEEWRRQEDPEDFAPDDPMRPEKPKTANWTGIIALGQATLLEKSKALLVAARMTEALVKEHGFAGLRDGLGLMGALVEQCWDRLIPVLEEEGDMERRAGPFNWLDDAERGARFPNTLHTVPIVFGPEGSYSWVDWRQSQDGKGKVSREMFEKAILATPLEKCETAAADLQASLEEMTRLGPILDNKMKEVAPSLSSVRQAAEECRKLLNDILQRKRPLGAAGGAEPAAEGATAAPGPARAPTTRADVYRQLAQAAAVLREIEPHSPIPYLIHRAVELGSLPFPQLIKELVRDAKILAELNREFGIKKEEAEKD